MYAAYRPLLLWVAGGKFNVPEEDCDPIVQDALLSFLTTATKVEKPKAWLIAAVCNASRHYWRVRARAALVETEHIDQGFDAPNTSDIEALDRRLLVRALLARLVPKQREVLRLHYFEGKTAVEIAEAFDTTPGYAEKLIVTALTNMRRLYARAGKRHGGEPPSHFNRRIG
ncbi:MAG: sigma-70 family RNA polymerase sigma factor [Acidobacteriota bacterium]|nr:sigma-70 family RNA polymerase sigma factor [Acidobacteriota bacterium]